MAADSGHGSVIRLLLSNGADANMADRDGVTPLARAAAANHKLAVAELLAAKVDIDPRTAVSGNTPLMLASQRGAADAVRLLLKFNAQPNLKNAAGNTALHLAVRAQHADIAAMLMQAGADPTLANNKRVSPLELARMAHDETLVAALERASRGQSSITGWFR